MRSAALKRTVAAPLKAPRSITTRTAALKPRKKLDDRHQIVTQIRDVVEDGIDHSAIDIHSRHVDPVAPIRKPRKKRGEPVEDRGEGQSDLDVRAMDAFVPVPETDPLMVEVLEDHKRRQLWIRSETAITNQCLAWCRRLAHVDGQDAKQNAKEGRKLLTAVEKLTEHPLIDQAMAATLPLLKARMLVAAERKEFEKKIAKTAKKLPVADFAIATKGISLVGLSTIIGEAGTLTKYSNPGKLWKRMGLSVHFDKAYSTWRRDGGLAIEEWKDAGYSPTRRSVSWNVGSSLIGGMGKGNRPLVGEDISLRTDLSYYEKLFIERLRYEAERNPEHARPPTAEGKESFSAHAANRSRRYVEKRFLKNLWREWRRISGMPYEDPVYDEMAA